MPQVKITEDGGDVHYIDIVGSWPSTRAAVEAHGFDPDSVTISEPGEYIVRRTTETDYQVEDPSGNVLVSTTYQTEPRIPDDISEDIVTYAENNGPAVMHELRKMMLIGFRYVDDR